MKSGDLKEDKRNSDLLFNAEVHNLETSNFARFQVSAAVQLRPLFVWYVMPYTLLVIYQNHQHTPRDIPGQ